MNEAQLQLWLPPVLSLFGTLIVVLFAAWLNTRVNTAQIEALRTEMKQSMNELRLEFRSEVHELKSDLRTEITDFRVEATKEFSDISQKLDRIDRRVERLENQHRLIQS